MIDVRRLRVLREVAAAGSLSAAARSLGYTPSAVSQQLVALQRETGVSLIERRGRRIELTTSAHTLLEHAHVIFAQLERAEADLAAAAARLDDTVRLAAPATALRRLVPAALAELSRTTPGLDVQVSDAEPDDVLPALSGHRLDVAIAHEYDLLAPRRTDGLHRRELVVEPMLLLGRTSPRGASIALAELAEHRWLLPPQHSSCGQLVRRACEAAGFEPTPAAISADFSALAALAQSGLGVTLVPSLALTPDERARARALSPPLERRLFAAARDGSEQRPAVAAVLAALTHAVPCALGPETTRR